MKGKMQKRLRRSQGKMDLHCQEVQNLLCGSVAVDLALPLSITGLDSELDGLAVDDGLDIRVGHFEGVWFWE